MPKLPRVSGAEAVRAFQRLGFEIARQKGSHIVMRRGASGCVVPNHRELKTGTLGGAHCDKQGLPWMSSGPR